MSEFALLALDLTVVCALWVWGLLARELRSSRTVALIVSATVIYLAATQLGPPVGVPLRTVAVVGTLWLLLFHDSWFVAMDPSVRRFYGSFKAVLEKLRELADKRRADDIDPSFFIEQVDCLLGQARALEPPNSAWASLRDSVVKHLVAQLERYRAIAQGRGVRAEALSRAQHELEQIQTEYVALRRRSLRLWT